jgi:hypothetical protein
MTAAEAAELIPGLKLDAEEVPAVLDSGFPGLLFVF